MPHRSFLTLQRFASAGAVLVWSLATGFTFQGADKNATIVIAAVGPLTGSSALRGKDMTQSIRMAAAEVNAAGGINGRRIQIDFYDDGDEPDRAREMASKVAATPAVAVLGQVASSAAVAAGEVYKEERIPAITGAASEARMTADNEWFFRLLSSAAGQGEFLADYARYQLGAREIIVLRESGTAGAEFATAFRERAKSGHLRIVKDIEFTPAQAREAAALDALVPKLRGPSGKRFIVFGTQFAETPEVLRAFRDKLGSFTGFGYSSVGTEALSAALANDEHDRHPIGFYTDGLMVAAPQLADVAGYTQTVFATRYKQLYGSDPNPEAIRWYESARLIFQAIDAKHVDGSDCKVDRQTIRNWLASRDRPEAAAAGVAGPIYFDKQRNVQRGMTVGVFYGGHLVSAPIQFTPVTNPDDVPGWDKLVSGGMVIANNGMQIVKTPVVYAGIDLNSLDNIDTRASTFAADFFLWFRYQDELAFDPHEVEFPTAASGGQLGKEVWHRTKNGFTTVTYHVKGVFHADYEFSRFPFDQQSLKIPIQVRNSTSYTLIMAYSNAAARARAADAKSVLASKLWRLQDQIFYRDVVAYESALGDVSGANQSPAIEINRINAAMDIKRDVFGFAIKNFLPLLCILIALLIGYALAPDVINPRVSIGVTALLTTSVLYQKLAGDLPSVTYIISMDYVFFAFFAICVLFLALTVVTYETGKAKMAKPTKLLNQLGAVLTLVGLGGTLLFVWVKYWGHAAAA